MDRWHDDFYEKFLEQRNQKLNNFEQPSREDYLPFPIEQLRTAPVEGYSYSVILAVTLETILLMLYHRQCQ